MTPLDDLVVDEAEFSEEMLETTLEPFVRFTKGDGSLVLQPSVAELTSKQQITVILLAQMAKKALDLADTEWIAPADIADESGIKAGTIYPAVRALAEQGIVEGKDGEYRIPPYGIEIAKEYVDVEG